MGSEMCIRDRYPAPTSRTDGNGEVEVLGPGPTALDVLENGVPVATFVVVGAAAADTPVQGLVVPRMVKVRVRVKGIDAKPSAWLHGPDPLLAAPEERTGFARVDGKTLPGWKIFESYEGGEVAVGDGPPYEIEVVVPRDRDVALGLGVAPDAKRLVIHALEPTTIDVDWATLPAPPKGRGSGGWASTREGLDQGPGGPARKPEGKTGKDAESEPSKGIPPAR